MTVPSPIAPHATAPAHTSPPFSEIRALLGARSLGPDREAAALQWVRLAPVIHRLAVEGELA